MWSTLQKQAEEQNLVTVSGTFLQSTLSCFTQI